MAYKKLFKKLFEQYTAKYKREPKGLELIKIKLKAADLQRESDKLIEFPRDKIKKFFDPNDPLPYYNETPGEFARRETPGSIENLRQEMKIAYRNEFDRLTGNETAEELTEMLKNLDIDGVPFAGGGGVKKIIKLLTKKKKSKKPIDRDMFQTPDKRQMNADELKDFEMAMGDALEGYDFDGTIGDAQRILKEQKKYMDDMFSQYNLEGGSKRLGGPNDPMAAAIDNASPGYTGDLKYDAQLVADDLAEKMYGVEYDDLTQVQQLDLYDKSYKALVKNQGEFKQMQNLSKPEKTLESIKETGTINISDPNVADEFTKFMKETDSKGFKDIEEKIKLESFDTTGRKKNADGGQATSTGLNYLLGEDDTNSRVPYASGGRRGFLKLLAGLGTAGVAFKTGLMSLGKGAAKPAAKVATEAATGGAPAHFLKLVAKIKALGDDSPKLAVKDREVVTTYKDYTLTEDITTGEQTIQRMKIDDDLKYDASEFYGRPVGEEVYMNHRPGKGQMDETTKGKTPPDEYTEDTSLIRSDRPAEGEIMETVSGVPDDIFEEVGEAIPEAIRKEKAGGGIMKIIKKLVKPKKKKLETVKDFVEKRKFLKSMVGETEKNKKARQLAEIKEAVEEARKNPGFKFKDVDIDKDIRPIFEQSKDRTLNAGGGIITKLIKKLNTISPGSTKRGKLSKPMSKRAKDKKQLREAIENFSKRNRAR